jgi:pyruvate/2-oxoglutarate dehydrogenase complex dihydrolipoamide acyltransferase (E2) component
MMTSAAKENGVDWNEKLKVLDERIQKQKVELEGEQQKKKKKKKKKKKTSTKKKKNQNKTKPLTLNTATSFQLFFKAAENNVRQARQAMSDLRTQRADAQKELDRSKVRCYALPCSSRSFPHHHHVGSLLGKGES